MDFAVRQILGCIRTQIRHPGIQIHSHLRLAAALDSMATRALREEGFPVLLGGVCGFREGILFGAFRSGNRQIPRASSQNSFPGGGRCRGAKSPPHQQCPADGTNYDDDQKHQKKRLQDFRAGSVAVAQRRLHLSSAAPNPNCRQRRPFYYGRQFWAPGFWSSFLGCWLVDSRRNARRSERTIKVGRLRRNQRKMEPMSPRSRTLASRNRTFFVSRRSRNDTLCQF
jgi:hypothetical protein